jgi:hypothetical protein
MGDRVEERVEGRENGENEKCNTVSMNEKYYNITP